MSNSRLTEEDVHAACADIAAQGERPTALKLLDSLGRGSLTTITKYLNSWNQTEEAQTINAESLPAVVELPEALSKDGGDLLKKIWNIAKGIADAELDVQREALRHAEKEAQTRVEEAFAFSEAQAIKIERLEEGFRALKEQLDEEYREHQNTQKILSDADKSLIGLSKDNEQLQHEVETLQGKILELEKQNKDEANEKKALQTNHAAELKKKEAEIKSLDMQIHKLQASLDLSVNANDKLKAEIKNKRSELSSSTIELEKLAVRYETTLADMKTAKDELTAARQMASEAEKRMAKLEGQLEIYQKMDQKTENSK